MEMDAMNFVALEMLFAGRAKYFSLVFAMTFASFPTLFAGPFISAGISSARGRRIEN
jgi:hypothetical protein